MFITQIYYTVNWMVPIIIRIINRNNKRQVRPIGAIEGTVK